MRNFCARVMLAVWLWGGGGVAALAEGPDEASAALSLEAAALDLFRDRPDDFHDLASEAIIGHGQSGRIDSEGIARMIAVRRAASRSSHLRWLQVADLDNDAEVSRQEVGAVLPTLSARLRARLVHLQRDADGDGNGVVDAQELRDCAEASARRSLNEKWAQDYRWVMLADPDRDGWVSLEEIAATMARPVPES
ncbi:hypothetical protein LCL97_04365 [Seohaeicola saemankumensis]|nr:hypothetical protein [Seohaeicola saemankumensis]MCA0870042.1 hypothetical protein [Seohaeicola saemankumensis]